MNAYTATYHTISQQYYQATLIFSSVTLTIRYKDEHNDTLEVHWLGKNIISLEERPSDAELQYRYDDGTMERLIIRDPVTIGAIKKSFRHYAFAGSKGVRIFGSVTSRILIVSGAMLAIVLAAYLWFVPWLGERVAMSFSKDHEISMGEQMYRSVMSNYKTDQRKTKLLNEFYQQLNYQVGYPVQITVVSSNEVNAFAIPGGHIVVYDAILSNMKTPEELAALLGHESSHIALRHSLRNMFRSVARKMFLSLVVGSESGIASVLIDNADNLKGLQYSRSLETEADDNGMHLMAANQIDPQGMLRLMDLLQQESGNVQQANFLSTHPVFDRRIDNIRQQLKKYPAITTGNSQLKNIFHEIYENSPSSSGGW